MNILRGKGLGVAALFAVLVLLAGPAVAGEADINLPDFSKVTFTIGGGQVSGTTLMYLGLVVCLIGLVFGLIQYNQIAKIPVVKEMADVSEIIWETCKTYLLQQGKFLMVIWALVGLCIIY